MRIAMISEHASPLAALGSEEAGGQNVHVADLATALAEQGHQVRVYTRRDATALPSLVTVRDRVSVVHVPAGPPEPVDRDSLLPYMPAFGRWLSRAWGTGEWMPDVAHAHFWMSGLAAVAASRSAGTPVVQTYHALGTVKHRHQGPADPSPAQRIGSERELGRVVARVVAQCRDEVRELTHLGVPRSQIIVIPSGVDIERFTPDGPAMPRDPDRPRILTVGRFVARKGYDDVIRALREVPGAECVLIGGPPTGLDGDPFAQHLWEVARACRVDDRLRLVGAVPPSELPRWYRSADVVAIAPWYEPFGLVPLEAMACGVPVIGTAVGGITDTIVAGHTGELVPARDPQALGRSLRWLLDDPERRRAYGAAGRERARKGYSWREAANRLSDVYASVAGRHSSPQPVGQVVA